MIRRLALLLLLASTPAWGQTTPQFTAGGSVFGRTAPQWNSYFGAKVDVHGGTLYNPTIVNGVGLGITGITGDVVAGPGSGGVVTSTISSQAVTYQKIQNVGASRLLGNPLGSSGSTSEISLGAGLSFSGSSLLIAANAINLSQLTPVAANTVLGNSAGSTANALAMPMPSCSTSASALNWTSASGFGCNAAVNAATLGGATFAAPGPIGGTTPSAGTFTTLNLSGTLTSTGNIILPATAEIHMTGDSGATTFALYGDSAQTILNAASGGTLGFRLGNSSIGTATSSGWTLSGTLTLSGSISDSSSSSFLPQVTLTNTASDANAAYFILLKGRAGGTTTQNGDSLGTFMFEGYDSTNTAVHAAFIAAQSNGAAVAGFVPAGINFFTSSNTGNILTASMLPSQVNLAAGVSLFDNGTAPTGTIGSGYVRAASPTLTGTVVTGSVIQVGGTTSSFPSLRLSGTEIDFTLADNSAFSAIKASTVNATVAVNDNGTGPTGTAGTGYVRAGVPAIQGDTSGGSAAAGVVGEVLSTAGAAPAGTVTITIASPAVISDTGACAAGAPNGCVSPGSVVNFTTTGALPTGITAGTNYYVLSTGFVAGTSYEISTTPFGSAVNTSGTQSGTQTRVNTAIAVNNTPVNGAVIALTAGDWDCWGKSQFVMSSTNTQELSWIGSGSNSMTGLLSFSGISSNSIASTGGSAQLPNGTVQINISSPTNYYLVGDLLFSTGTGSFTGMIQCRRRR